MQQLNLNFGPAHCMVDIETLGTRAGDVVLSLGACLFNIDGVYSEIYMTIDPQDSKALGLKAQKSTLEWWAKQSENARAEAFKGELSVATALKMFSMWLPKDTKVWGNGANFDNVLIAGVYRAAKTDLPWKFWDDRCYRTVKNLFPAIKMERTGTHHHALDDAISQANHLIEIAKANGLALL